MPSKATASARTAPTTKAKKRKREVKQINDFGFKPSRCWDSKFNVRLGEILRTLAESLCELEELLDTPIPPGMIAESPWLENRLAVLATTLGDQLSHTSTDRISTRDERLGKKLDGFVDWDFVFGRYCPSAKPTR